MANTKVTSRVLANDAVLTANIADDQVTTAKIADDVALGGNPTTTTQSAGNNTTRIATTAFVTTAVANIVDSAPSALDTLNELAAALGDDANFSTTVTNSIATKLPLAGGTMSGNIVIADDSANTEKSLLIRNTTVTSMLGVEGSSANRFVGSAANNMFLGTTTADGIEFATNNNVRTVIDSSGKVGIATTSPRGVLDLGSGSGDGALDNTPANYQLILEAAQSTTGDIGRNIAFVNSTNNVSAAINSVDGGSGVTQDLMFAVANSGTLSEVMRLDATGKVGIGTTSPNDELDIAAVHSQLRLTDTDDSKFVQFSYSGGKLVARNNSTDTTANQFTLTEDGDFGIGTINPAHQLHVVSSGNAEFEVERSSGAAVFTQAQSALGVTGTSSNHDFGFLTNGSVRMRIDNTGRVGINRTPAIANSKLEVGGADSVPLINVEASGNTAGIGIGGSAMKFYHGTSEKMRIDTDGRMGVNATGTGYARITLQETSTGSSAIYALNNAASINSSTSSLIHCQFNGDASLGTGTPFIKFANQNDFIGSITGAPSNVAYNTSSDRDLKNNIVDASSQLDTIKAIQVREYDWKIDSHHDLGVIAQELYELIPNVVTKGVESDDNGRSMPWSVDYGRLTPYLVKAIQEQQEQIETLKKEVEELKGG